MARHWSGYELTILTGTAIALCFLGWHWKSMQLFLLVVVMLSLLAIYWYGTDLAFAEKKFFLKYFFASQSAIMWMSALFVLATASYFFSLFFGIDFSASVATSMTWCAAAMGLIGLLVRWRESYLIHPDVGHIPVSNLYEVFILFCLICALLYLYYERRYHTRQMGGFVLLVISAAVGFILWYTFDRGAHEIQPLVPALQSYWMKIHVPANFIGYAAFALSAMVGVVYLLRSQLERSGTSAIAARLPTLRQLDDVMYRSIGARVCLFYHRHRAGCYVGSRGLGWLLVLGSEGNLGTDCLAELRSLATYAPRTGTAWGIDGMVVDHRPVCHSICFYRGQYVPFWSTLLRGVIIFIMSTSSE